jgi:hypothetical protein
LGPLDAIWHLLNFFAPALGIGCLTPLMAKLLWRAELRGRSLVNLVAALVLFGRDGRMAGYALMVGSAALSLWWVAFHTRAG